MNRVKMRVLFVILGVLIFASVLVFEIDGLLGFLMATLGVLLIIIALTLRGLIELFANLF